MNLVLAAVLLMGSVPDAAATRPAGRAEAGVPQAGAASAGTPTVQAGPPVQISRDPAGHPHVEPHLAVDPTDPRRLVVASMVARPEGMGMVVFVSHDSGATWSSRPLPECGFDPWVEFASTGTGYVSCLAGDDALVFSTPDAGLSWSDPLRIEAGEDGELDHTSLAVTPDGSRLVIAGLQNATRDGRRYVVPFVSPVSWRQSDPPFRTRLIWNNLWANTLNATWMGSTLLLAYVDFLAPERGPLRTLRIWSSRSPDGGRSFVPPSLVAEVHESSTIPVLSRGGPGPAACVAFDDVRDGRSGVWLVRSDDAGETWSRPLPVVMADAARKTHFNAQAAVDGDGHVLVAWYEAAGPGRCFKVFVAASADGGRSFSAPCVLRDTAFCIEREGSHDPIDLAERWPYGGDYFGVAAVAESRFYVVWSDAHTGAFQVWGAPVRIEAGQ